MRPLVSLGEACHGRGRRRPTSAATTIVGTNRRKRGPRKDPSPRVRAAEPPSRPQGVGDHGMPGRMAGHRAPGPRARLSHHATPENASRFLSDDATPCDDAIGSERKRAVGLESRNPFRGGWDRAPLATDARSVSPAGVRTKDWSPRCKSTDSTGGSPADVHPAKGERHICEPERVSSPSSCTGGAGSLPTRTRDDPQMPARRIAPPRSRHCGPAAPRRSGDREGVASRGAIFTFAVATPFGVTRTRSLFDERPCREGSISDGRGLPLSVRGTAAPTTTSTTDCFRG